MPDTTTDAKNDEQLKIATLTQKLFIGLSGLTTLGAICHVLGYSTFDKDALYYLIAAGVFLIFPSIKTFALNKDGITFETERIKAQVEEVKQQVADVEAKAEINSIAIEEGVGRKLSLSIPEKANINPLPIVENDPQKNQWGGQAQSNKRKISATVREAKGLFEVQIRVDSTEPSQNPLTGDVIFHLHPTFNETDIKVPVKKGTALITRLAWGAFTVGAEADNGNTRLELDLAELPDAPEVFRSR